MSDEDKTFSGSFVLDLRIWWRQAHTLYRPENLNKSELKTYTSTRKNTFTLVTLQCFSISGVISAAKM